MQTELTAGIIDFDVVDRSDDLAIIVILLSPQQDQGMVDRSA